VIGEKIMNKLLIAIIIIAIIGSVGAYVVLSQPNTPSSDITYYYTPKPGTTNQQGNRDIPNTEYVTKFYAVLNTRKP
jgi:hypothetical protein